mgnify:CR=1 FL=1
MFTGIENGLIQGNKQVIDILKQSKDAYKNKPAMYYGELTERTTLPTGPNGYPMFTSCSFLNQKDTERFRTYLLNIEKAVDDI